VCLAVSENTRQAYDEFRGWLSKLLGREVKMPTVLRYLLAFLNSSYAQELLTTGHRPRPGDVFQVSDELLEELSIPLCKTRRDLQQLLDAVDACMIARTPAALQKAESQLNNLVSSLYSKA
jgi:Mg2+/Co2+ transporter CorC